MRELVSACLSAVPRVHRGGRARAADEQDPYSRSGRALPYSRLINSRACQLAHPGERRLRGRRGRSALSAAFGGAVSYVEVAAAALFAWAPPGRTGSVGPPNRTSPDRSITVGPAAARADDGRSRHRCRSPAHGALYSSVHE
jgi:hypothetical protein